MTPRKRSGVKRFRRDGVYGRRIEWWYPWGVHQWHKPKFWLGGDEWCNIPWCLTLPPLGAFVVYWRPLRDFPCTEHWLDMDDAQRSDYLPGGHLSGGCIHDDVIPSWMLEYAELDDE